MGVKDGQPLHSGQIWTGLIALAVDKKNVGKFG